MPDIGNPEGTVHNPAQEVQAQADRLEQMTADEVTREIRTEIDVDEIRTYADRLKTPIEVDHLASFSGDKDDASSDKWKADQVLIATQRILLALKQGKIKLPDTMPDEAKSMTLEILSKVGNSVNAGAVDEKSAAYIYPFLTELIKGDGVNQDVLVRIYQSLAPVSVTSRRIFEHLQTSVADVMKENGMSDQELRDRIGVGEALEPEAQTQDPATQTTEDHATVRHHGGPLTQEEANELKTTEEKIRLALSDKNSPLLADPEAMSKVRDVLRIEIPAESAAEELARAGISIEEAKRFQELGQRFLQDVESNRRRGGSMTNSHLEKQLNEAAEEFDIENVVRSFMTKKDDGSYTMTEENRREFRKVLTKYYYELFREFDQNPSRLFQDLYDFYTHSPYINGLRGLLTEVVQSDRINTLLGEDKDGKDGTKDFLRGMINYTHSLYNYSQLFHDLPIYALDAGTHEQWKNFIAQLYPSELATFFDDPIMDTARSEITRYIKKRIALNGNQLPEDIFDAKYEKDKVIYSFKDQTELADNIRKTVESMGVKPEEWEISRALSYGRGIGLLNLQDIQTMGNADSNPTFRSMPDIIAKLWQRHKWGQGRGGSEILYAPEILTMDIEHNPDTRSLMSRIRPFSKSAKRKWVPQAVYDYAHDKERELGAELDHRLLDREGSYQELMNVFNLGDQISRAGWRVDYLMPGEGKTGSAAGIKLLDSMWKRGLDFKEGDKLGKKLDWGPKEWTKFYDAVTENLGSGALWFYADKQIEVETMRALAKALNKPGGEGNYDEIHKLYEEYMGEKKAFEKVMTLADGSMGTLYDYKQQKEWEIRGRIFEYYLQRSPGDFLLNLNLVVPDLLKPGSDLWKLKAGQKMKFEQELVFEKWGVQGVDQLKEVMEWYNSLEAAFTPEFTKKGSPYRFDDLDGFPDKQKEVRREKIFSDFYEEMGRAFEKARSRSHKESNKDGKKEVKLRKEDIENPIFRRFVFGGDGVTGLKPILEKFKMGVGDGVRVDGDNFFYRMGKAWAIKNGKDNPMTSDIHYLEIYEDIAKSGQGLLRRLHADIDTWDKVASEVVNLPLLLKNAAESNNFDEIYKLHEGIRSLEGIVGFDETQKANYIVGSLVSQYFWEHSNTRGWFASIKSLPARYLLGNKVALSKLHGGFTAYTMNTREIREYFRYLAYDKNILKKKGRWSYEQAKKGFNAETDRWLTQDVIPSSILVMLLFLFFRFFKQGIAELGDGGQKRR